MKIKLLIGVAAIAALTGCSFLNHPVPTTEISGMVGGQKFSLKNPKNTTMTNLVVEVKTNGTAKLSIGYVSSVNDSNVVESAYAGAAKLVTATGQQMKEAFVAGGEAAGSVAHTVVTGAP